MARRWTSLERKYRNQTCIVSMFKTTTKKTKKKEKRKRGNETKSKESK